jgi:hypothetical protein
MSNLGPIYEEDVHYSPRRADAKGITRDTGTNIVAISTTRQIGIAIPTDTSGGLVKNVAYVCDYDGSMNRVAFIPIFGNHTHDGTTGTGGSLLDVLHSNSMNVAPILDMLIIDASYFHTSVSGGAFADVTSANDAVLEIKTGAVTNNYANGRVYAVLLSWAKKIIWQMNANLSHNNNLVVRCGINVDRIQDAQDNARRQMGIEGCDGHGTNWVIINANGNSASLHVTPTTIQLNLAGENNYKLVHTPATECRLYLNGVSNAVSGTNVASTGDTQHDKLLNLGVKLAAGTTEKFLKVWHNQILAAPGTNQLF